MTETVGWKTADPRASNSIAPGLQIAGPLSRARSVSWLSSTTAIAGDAATMHSPVAQRPAPLRPIPHAPRQAVRHWQSPPHSPVARASVAGRQAGETLATTGEGMPTAEQDTAQMCKGGSRCDHNSQLLCYNGTRAHIIFHLLQPLSCATLLADMADVRRTSTHYSSTLSLADAHRSSDRPSGV